MIVLVTVGTTRFDTLIASILCPQLLNDLHDRGVTGLIVQHGHSPLPNPLPVAVFPIETLPFHASLTSLISRAGLVIAHAGAGTILETVQACKPLLLVPNDTLMGGHQTQIAKKMKKMSRATTCPVR